MRSRLMGLAAMLLAIAVGVAGPWAVPTPAMASGVGPTIAVGTPTISGGKVLVPIETRGEGFVPYIGFSIHLRWNPAIFQLDGASESGGPFDGSAALCLGPTPSLADQDGGGAIISCFVLGSVAVVSSAGLLTTFSFTPVSSGCSQLRLTTVGPPDNGNSTSGTYTVEREANGKQALQVNGYVHGMVDATAASCGANASSSPTPIPAGIDPAQPTSTAIPVGEITPALGGNEAAQPGATIRAGTLPRGAGTPASGAVVTGTETSGTAASGTEASGTAAVSTPEPTGTDDPNRTPGASKTEPSGVSANKTATAARQAETTSGDGGRGSSTRVVLGIAAVVMLVLAGAGGAWAYLRRRN